MIWPNKLRLSTAAIAGMLAFGTAAAQADSFNKPADLQAIAAIEQALATQTDISKLIHYYAPDAFVEDMIAPGIYRGRKQIAASFAQQFTVVKSMQGNVLDSSVISDGAFACAATRASFNTVLKNGSTIKLSTRQLDAFKKINGKWQIIQEQISVPMDPKTGLGAMNPDLPVRGPIVWSSDPVPGPAEVSPAVAKEELKQWVLTGSPVVDVNKMVTFFGPTKDILLYDLTLPGEYRSRTEILNAYAPLMNQLSSATDVMPLFTADSDGKFGVQTDTQDLTINFKNGKSQVIAFRQTDCLSRTNGNWQTFLEMLSFPVDPKTGKSVTTPQ